MKLLGVCDNSEPISWPNTTSKLLHAVVFWNELNSFLLLSDFGTSKPHTTQVDYLDGTVNRVIVFVGVFSLTLSFIF